MHLNGGRKITQWHNVKYWQLTDLPLAVGGLSNIQTWQENVQVYVQSAKLKKDELQCAAKVLWCSW
jgi:hypothetical protein